MRAALWQRLGDMPSIRLGTFGALVASGLLLGTVAPLEAQYFGRNKVQYDEFDFRVLETPHFDIHYYPEAGTVIEDVSRMAERWYERYARLFQHDFERSKPLVLYADHPDFQQTNTLQSFLGEGTGGVTESLKNRVIMPMTGSYWDTDHVLGHELVHAFQYNMAQSRQGVGIMGLSRLPLWLVEGMAEYLSVGRNDPLTAMWLRDAVRRDDIPTIKQMTREMRYFPYRFGQALWAYIGGTYGDDAVVNLFRRSMRQGWEPALNVVLGVDSDTLSAHWAEAIRDQYLPLMEDKTTPSAVGTLLLAPDKGSGSQNLAPSISPDGREVVYMSEKNLFSFDLFLANARTGEIKKTLSSASADPHFDALRFMDSSGAWSPDGTRLAFAVFADGDNALVIMDPEREKVLETIAVEGIGAMQGPSWSPDGRSLVFSGSKGGVSDLYLHDVASGVTTQLTDDKYADFQPVFSPDGRTIAFATDRGYTTDFELLSYAKFQVGLLDMETGEVETISLFGEDVKHINPQYSPQGDQLYFISDPDGFSNIYRLELATGQVERVTNVATAVSGISWSAPAMSVSAMTGKLVFSVFDEFEFHVYTLTADEADERAEVVAVGDVNRMGRNLPPVDPRVPSRVAVYLNDYETGLEPPGTFVVEEASDFESELQLDFVGQPTIGVGADAFGSYIGGGASAYFSDMLGDRFLGVALAAQGTVKDIGGQVFYMNQRRRWNWGYGVGRIPYQFFSFSRGQIQDDSGNTFQVFNQNRFRIYYDYATGILAYPFSMTRRVEANVGFLRYSYDIEQDQFILDDFGNTIDRRRVQLDDEEPDPQNLFQASIALVGDNSFLAFTSPVRGRRYRVELETTHGTADFQTLTLDYRRYFSPSLDVTLAFRGMHYGRYNYSREAVNNNFIRPIFLGYETLIRGYAWESFTNQECEGSGEGFSSCPVFDRLFGQKVALANFEVRVPFIGTEQFGLVDLPYIPMELVAFADVGVAFDDWSPAADDPGAVKWEFARRSGSRIPVVSTGLSSRFNILGVMILEAYYAYPFQRPDKGWHWGFNLAPGW